MFDTYREADEGGVDADGFKLFGGGLAVSGGRRVYGQRAHVTDVDQQGVQGEGVHEFLGGFGVGVLEGEAEDGTSTLGQVLLGQFVVGGIGQAGVGDRFDLGVVFEELGDFEGVLYVAFYAQREGFKADGDVEGVGR